MSLLFVSSVAMFFCCCCSVVPFSSIIKIHACSCNVQKFVDPTVTPLIRHSVHFVSILHDSFETILLIKKTHLCGAYQKQTKIATTKEIYDTKKSARNYSCWGMSMIVTWFLCILHNERQPLTSPKMTISTIKKKNRKLFNEVGNA